MINKSLFSKIILSILLVLYLISCKPSAKIETTSELGPETLARIDAINQTLATGAEIGPETRALIDRWNDTIGSGIGLNESTLERMDELLRRIEDGLKFGIDTETLETIDGLIETIDRAPDKWGVTTEKIVKTLESSAGTVAGQMANEISTLMNEARIHTQYMADAVGGATFRCNVQFVGDKLDEFIGHSLIGRLQAIIHQESVEPEVPIPWVCLIIPDEVNLDWESEKLVYRNAVLRITGYNFRDANRPDVYMIDGHSNKLESIQLPHPQRTSDYQIELNLQGTDFTNIPKGSYFVFRWPNISETSAIAIVVGDPPAEIEQQPELTINVSSANIYKGPNTAYNVIGPALRGATYTVKYQNANGTWWLIDYAGEDGWISDDTVIRNEASVPVVPNPPPPPPTADFSLNPAEGHSPLSVQFTDRSSGNPTEWQWDFGDGNASSEERNPIHTYSQAGRYTIKLTVNNDYATAATTKEVIVNAPLPKPTANFDANPRQGRAPLEVNFTDRSGGNPTSWQWNFGDGATSNKQNPTHRYNKQGVYTIRLTAANAQGSHTTEKKEYIFADRPFFPANSVIFTAYTNLGDNVEYNTNISIDDYVCGIVGMAAWDGDINEDSHGDIIRTYMYPQGGTWWIRADFRTHYDRENWDIHVMCIDKRKAPEGGYIYKEFNRIGDNASKNTGVSTRGYWCSVVGMAAWDGDINENDSGSIIQAYTYGSGGNWWVKTDFRSHHNAEDWSVNVMCVDRTQVSSHELFKYETYSNLGDNVEYNTGISTGAYSCGIAGMHARDGDINENDDGNIIRTYMYRKNGTWWIRADFRSHYHNENWDINILCASKSITQDYLAWFRNSGS